MNRVQTMVETTNPRLPASVEAAPVDARRKVVVRSHTKAVYFYPTVLAALLCAAQVPADGGGGAAWGNLFLPVFFANMLVVLFEFSSMRVLFLSLVAMLAGLAAWSFGLSPLFSDALGHVNVSMNRHGYLLHAAFFGALILADLVWAHLNRWEFAANDVKHVQLFAGHTENYPGRGLRFQVRMEDVWERLMLGAGTLLLVVGSRRVRIQNVPFVRGKVRELERFVRTTGVFDDTGDVFGSEDEFEDA